MQGNKMMGEENTRIFFKDQLKAFIASKSCKKRHNC